MENITILFLDQDGFPIEEAGGSGLPVAVPEGAAGARLEIHTAGFTLVRAADWEISGRPVEAFPQNAVGIYDGDLFSHTFPRYLLAWKEDKQKGRRELSFRLHIERPPPEQIPAILLFALTTRREEMEVLRLEAETLRGALSDIYNSRAWRVVRGYYTLKDLLKNPLKKNPLILKIASLFGVRPRSKPMAAKASRVREIEALYRRGDRRLILLSELPAKSLGEMRVAVHLHLFYLEMASFFIERLSHIPVPFDLYISVTEDGGDTAARFAKVKNAASVTVEVVENRGRDVMPMIRTFGPALAGADVFLHIHSKKSPHNGALAGWLDFLMDNLLSKHTSQILSLFQSHPELGILYPEPLDAFPYWTLTNGANLDQMARLFETLGIPLGEKYADFPVGTMFWARGAALAPLLTAAVDGFPDEEGQVDGTLAHAVERSLCLIASHAGFKPAQTDASKNRVAIGPGLKNLPEYISIDRKSAFAYLQSFKNAAFDLFGTLVLSGYESDRELWGAMEAFDGFVSLREEAEIIARQNNGSPDIHNIYAELRRIAGLSGDECQRLKALEFAALLESCRARSAVAGLLNGLTGKRINAVIAEDTVWPEAYIQRILEKCGVRHNLDIYPSASIGYYKKDGGLYDFLKSRFKGQSFVNVGDDEILDAHIPNTRRIHHLHVMRPGDMAAVIGLTGAEKRRYYDRMADDPFCLLDVMRSLD